MSRTAAAPRPTTGYVGYDCGQDHHNCLDVLRPDSCCDNQSYCYINGRGEARCCPIGSNCVADSPCSSRAYYCAVTVTVTASLPFGSTAPAPATQQGCCGRKCPQTSHFLCPPDLGGKCCPFGSRCQAGGNCLQIKGAEAEAETKTAASTSSSEPASTCSAPGAESESCAGTEGAGGGGPRHPESEKLSVGAKAGIGVAAVAVSLILGALWFHLQRRRRHRSSRQCDIHGRVELTGSAVPASAQNKPMLAAEADHGMPQSPRHHNTVPVEMASVSVQATVPVVLQERNYPPFVSMPPECPASPDGVCELAGYDILPAEQLPSPLTPPAAPPPFPATSNDFANGHKEKF
ncbi:hypothetical protein EsDP_00001893 [Epichloe bromicola]|uniref:Uncharacterized protein n=1 Tax=Epichloe bromicola TaxID=79588 RepID=A0ABQ0CJ65_9HYPO